MTKENKDQKTITTEEAIALTKQGHKVTLPEFKGYWFDHNGITKVMTKDGKVTDTPWLEEYKDRKDWKIVDIAWVDEVLANKELRRNLDKELQTVKSLSRSRERSLTVTKLQEAIMWLGMDLKRLNEPNPYPDSKNPNNTKIEPTADNLKL